MSDTTWHYRILGLEFGPVSFEFLLQQSEDGHLNAGTEVRSSADLKWTCWGAVTAETDTVIRTASSDGDGHCSAVDSDPTDEPGNDGMASWSWLPQIEESAGNPHGDDVIDSWNWLPAIADEPGDQSVAGHPAPTANESTEQVFTSGATGWYLLKHGHELGPIPLSLLIQITEEGGVTASDSVRRVEEAAWCLAETMELLRPALIEAQRRALSAFELNAADTAPGIEETQEDGNRDAIGGEPTSTSADPLAAAAAVTEDLVLETMAGGLPAITPALSVPVPLQQESVTAAESTSPVERLCSSESRSKDDRIPIRQARSARGMGNQNLGREFFVSAARLKITVAAAVALACCLMMLSWLVGARNQDTENWNRLSQVWIDWNQSGRTSSQSAGREVASDSRLTTLLRSIVDELESTTTSQEPARQNMLWAARDYLLPQLENPAGFDSRAAEHFLVHMNAAHQILGLPPSLRLSAATGEHTTEVQ